MNKLEERFEEIIWESNPDASMMDDLESGYLVAGYIKEARELAIEFGEYYYSWKLIPENLSINLGEYPGELLDDIISKIKNRVFNEFIEEKYGNE